MGNGEARDRLPAGSLPIDQTEWSGDHDRIKRAINARGSDRVSIDPDGNIWAANPDGTWTNHGPANTGSGKAKGRRGKNRRTKGRKE